MTLYVVAKGVYIVGVYSTEVKAIDQIPGGVKLKPCPNPSAGWNAADGSWWRIRIVELDKPSGEGSA